MAPCYLLRLPAELIIDIFCALVPDLHITIRSHKDMGPHAEATSVDEWKDLTNLACASKECCDLVDQATRLQKINKNVKLVVEANSLDEIMEKEEEQDEEGTLLPERFWVPDHVLSSFRTLDMRFGFELSICEHTIPATANLEDHNISFHPADVHMKFDTLVDRAGDMLDPLPVADYNSDTTDNTLELRSYPAFTNRDIRCANDTRFRAAMDTLFAPAVVAPLKRSTKGFLSDLVTANTLYSLRRGVDHYLEQKVLPRDIEMYLTRPT